MSLLRSYIVFCLVAMTSFSVTATTLPNVKADAPVRYIVQSGDTLWDIAELYLTEAWHWPQIWAVNPDISNPHLIYPGDELRLIDLVVPVGVRFSGNRILQRVVILIGANEGRYDVIRIHTVFDQRPIGDLRHRQRRRIVKRRHYRSIGVTHSLVGIGRRRHTNRRQSATTVHKIRSC